MNILFLSRRFSPDIGGVEKHVMEVGKIMVRKGHRVTVVTQSKGPNGNVNGINVQRIGSSTNKFQIWKEIWRLKDYIKEADIVHVHDVYFWYIPFRFLYPTKKSYITFHGFEGYPVKKSAIIVRKISEILANGNIIVGRYIKKWYHTVPNMIIYGAITPNLSIENTKNKITEKINVIFLGRLDVDTGFSTYADAISKLKEKDKVEFEIYGEGSLKIKAVEVGKVHSFTLKAERYIKNSDIVLSSSYLASMEAFNNKKLVISTYDNDLKKDILHMTPWSKWIVIAKNSDEMKDSILDFKNNPDKYDKNIEKAYNWVRTKSWENLAKTYLKLWEIK